MLQDGVEALQQIAEFVGRERPAPRFGLNNYLGTDLQVVTDLNAEGPAEAILEIVEIVIGHAVTRGCVSLRSTHPRRPAFEAEHADAIPSQHPMRDRSAPQNGLSAAKQERSGSTNGAGNGSFRARPYAPPIDPIFGSGIAIMPPAPNTWPLNIEPRGRFHRRRDFSVSAIHIAPQCGAFATYRRVSCLIASTICRCIAASRIGMAGAGLTRPIAGGCDDLSAYSESGEARIRTKGENRM